MIAKSRLHQLAAMADSDSDDENGPDEMHVTPGGLRGGAPMSTMVVAPAAAMVTHASGSHDANDKKEDESTRRARMPPQMQPPQKARALGLDMD